MVFSMKEGGVLSEVQFPRIPTGVILQIWVPCFAGTAFIHFRTVMRNCHVFS